MHDDFAFDSAKSLAPDRIRLCTSAADARRFGGRQSVARFAINAAMNHDLVLAIMEKRLVAFAYKAGQTRIVEPHDYGIRHGVEYLLGYQISGESRSGAPHGWKQFEVDWIRELRVLDRRFSGTRADRDQHHREWNTVFARVT